MARSARRLIADTGAKLIVSDVRTERCEAAAREHGATVIAPDAVTSTPCDVFSPCATGALIDSQVAQTIPCSVIAGAANNVLADAAAAQVLDHLVGREVLGWTEAQVTAKTGGIRDTLKAIFADAREHAITSVQAAQGVAERNIAEATAQAL